MFSFFSARMQMQQIAAMERLAYLDLLRRRTFKVGPWRFKGDGSRVA